MVVPERDYSRSSSVAVVPSSAFFVDSGFSLTSLAHLTTKTLKPPRSWCHYNPLHCFAPRLYLHMPVIYKHAPLPKLLSMSSTSNQTPVAPGGLLIPCGVDICPMTLGLFEAFYKTKDGKMEETAFARRFKTTLIIDNTPVTYYDTIAYLMSQSQSIMANNPEEQAACLQLIATCEEMLRIARKSPYSRLSPQRY
jgi:hypothetical protein